MLVPPLLEHHRPRTGFALIIVVLALTLITAMTIFFISDVGRERRGVDQYSRGGDSRHLADTAVNLVMGQINAATKEGTAAAPVSWASQPGMIRTYATGGNLSNAYKLYSWDNLIENGGTFDPSAAAEYPVNGWDALPAQYTDLNAPVNGVYPIADATIANFGAAASMSQTSSVQWDFPSAFAVATDAKGYFLPTKTTNKLPMPVKWLYILQDGTWIAPAGGTGNTANFSAANSSLLPSTTNPIVGRIAFWTDDETSKVNINTASEGNYWDTPKAGTLDELLLASNPPAKGEFQRIAGHPATTSLSAVFPEMRNGTFYRWTNLGSATSAGDSYLKQLKNIYDLAPRIDWGVSASGTLQGGSQGGTFPIAIPNSYYPPSVGPATVYPPTGAWTDPNTYAITTDSNRLYASADDLWFQPSRAANTAFGMSSDSRNNLSATKMAQRLFLFTANSRAPETTLFETPRISLWPITWPHPTSSFYVTGGSGSGARQGAPASLDPNNATLLTLYTNKGITPQEMLLAFDSTLNTDTNTGKGDAYYFQRQNPDSPTWDYSSDPTSAKIKRNYYVVNYLRHELSLPMPGMGSSASLDSKWGSTNADWISLNCFDYSRSLINQYTFDPNPTSAQLASSTHGMLYSYTGYYDGTASFHEINSFTSTPLRTALSTTNGQVYNTEGAYPALKEVAVVFYAASRVPPTVKPTVAKPFVYRDIKNPENWMNLISWNPATKTGSSQTQKMQAVMLFSFAQMSPGVTTYKGNTGYTPSYWIKVTPTTPGASFAVNGTPINLPRRTNTATVNGSYAGNSVQWTTLQGYSGALQPTVAALALGKNSTTGELISKKFDNTNTDPAQNYAYWSLVSDFITVPSTDCAFSFSGTTIQVDIYAPDPSGNLQIDPTAEPACLVSSQQINFGNWDTGPKGDPMGSLKFPIPLAPRWNVRQAAMIPSYSSIAPVSTPADTDPVTGGVLMPLYTMPSSTYPNWQAEICPAINLIGQMGTLSADTRNYPGTTLQAGLAAGGTEPLMYVYNDSAGRSSTNFATRVVDVLGTSTVGSTKPPYYSAETVSAEYAQNAQADFGGHDPTPGTAYSVYGGSQAVAQTQAYQVITPWDTVISMVPDPTVTGSNKTAGDPRLMGRGKYSAVGSASWGRIDSILSNTTPLTPAYTPALVYSYTDSANNTETRSTSRMQFEALGFPGTSPFVVGYRPDFKFGLSLFATRGSQTSHGPPGPLLGRDLPDSEVGVEGNVTLALDPNSDWTSMPGNNMDGGYLFRPDQEYQSIYPDTIMTGTLNVPYFPDQGLASIYTTSGSTTPTALAARFFSPNRQVPSPVILGTIPSDMNVGWQTLCFCPNPAITMNTGTVHPGLGRAATIPSAQGPAYTTLPDHLLLDLFWMPVAEPYPMSEQFSTAGKVNLNYAMMPFPYIQRKTALDAVLKSVSITAMPSNDVKFLQYYKSYGVMQLAANNHLETKSTRYPINVDATLKAFDYKFNKGDIFRSASQICDVFFYPNNPTIPNTPLFTDSPPYPTAITSWWNNNQLTGDNSREDPYNAVYSRLTTKSNTFTVHWKVQSLRKRTGSSATTWTEDQDQVSSELRGSTLIERYIDPNATNLPDYATNQNAPPLSQFYKWRVVSENYFRP